MLSLNEAVDAIAKQLGEPSPAADAEGDHRFALADEMELRLRALPDGRCLAWTEVSAPAASERDAEAKAAEFLRLRLARLRRNGAADAAPVTAAAGEDGGLLLYAALAPETAAAFLEQAGELLNEAEAMRRLLSGTRPAASGAGSLFSGMSGFFKTYTVRGMEL